MTQSTTTAPRAVQIFQLDEHRPRSPIAEKVWRTRSEPVLSFTSVAATPWKMVVTRYQDCVWLTLRGPESRATVVPVPQGAEFVGIDFRLGTRMPGLPFDLLVNGALSLPLAGRRSVWLNGSAWEIPTFQNADVFLERLFRRGYVVRDPVVEAVLRQERLGMAERSIRRRVRDATGISLGLIRQIERAHRAVALLERGVSILDVIHGEGYADQPHLTRSLRRFVGHTPAQIVRDQVAARSTS